MLQIIDYQETEATVLVGFKKHNFAVYGQIGKIEGFTKEQHLQKLYEQCKSAIDYETERYNQGKPNSIVTDLEGEEFIPELPKIKTLQLTVDKSHIQFEEGQENEVVQLSTITKDQYGEDFDIDVIYSSNIGIIQNNTLTIPNFSEVTEVVVTTAVGDINHSKILYVFPYLEPTPPEPSEMDLLKKENEYLNNQLASVNADLQGFMDFYFSNL